MNRESTGSWNAKLHTGDCFWQEQFPHTKTVPLTTELRGADVADVQLQKSAGKRESATIVVQNYQYDPATVQGFMRLVCSNSSLL